MDIWFYIYVAFYAIVAFFIAWAIWAILWYQIFKPILIAFLTMLLPKRLKNERRKAQESN